MAFLNGRNRRLAALAAGALLTMNSLTAAADDGLLPGDTLVTTGVRTQAPAYEIGNAISILDSVEIDRRQNPVISDLLRSVPGLAVNRGGGPGQLTQIRIRGAEGNHTLVLIDGIEANELNFNGEFDFASLLAIGIERVEILRGAQSALYGSDAIGGVVNIITKGGEPGLEAAASAEGGSHGTYEFGGLVSGGTGRATGALSAGYYHTDGINLSRFGNEKDDSRIASLNGKGHVDLTPWLKVDGVLRYVDTKSDNDAQDFDFPPTPTEGLAVDTLDMQKMQQFYGRGHLEASLFDGMWVNEAAISYANTKRDFINDDDSLTGNEGERLKLEFQSTLHLTTENTEHHLTGAFEREEMDFENFGAVPDALENQKRSDEQNSFIGEYRLGIADQVFLSAGVRHDDNQLFDNATTWRLAGAWRIPSSDTRLHASYGTGITNPGFFELFGFFPDFFIGNPNLQPEKSESFDVGIEQSFADGRFVIDVTYFHADLTDEIVTVFDSTTFLSSVENLVGKSNRQGVEMTVSAQLTDALSLSGSYTYVRSRQPDGSPEVRRPKHLANLNLNYAFAGGRGNVNLDLSYNGRQLDNEFASSTPESVVTLNDYLLVTLAASYEVADGIELFGRVENALDESYEEIFSYRSPGIGVFGGVRVAFGR